MLTRASVVVASVILAGPLAGKAVATTALPLGTGTACAMMSEAETRARLGVRKHHAIVCADPSGIVSRVLVGRKGTIACTDAIRVRGVSRQSLGTPCGAIRVHAATDAPEGQSDGDLDGSQQLLEL